MMISIIFEDQDLLVIDKPAGITVNKSDTTAKQVTIQDWVEDKLNLPKIFQEEDSDFVKRAGIVHRLDKETSGILIIAKNVSSFENMQKQFKDRTIKKTYTSLVHGRVELETGEINVPVGRLPWNKKQFGIFPGGKESKTYYKVLNYYKNKKTKEQLSLVELYPKSGRTHQIRVHMKYIGHPVFSDFLYAGRKTARKDRSELERVFLHAAKISFDHPNSGETISLESLLADQLMVFLETLEKLV